MNFLLATNNPAKVQELRPMFEAAGLEIICLKDLGLSFEANEDGDTFTSNAIQKATETAIFLKENGHNYAVIADDSGLVINALNGEPGVDSALYMGRDTPYTTKCQNLLDRLSATPDDKRTARFVCVLACCWPDGHIQTVEAAMEGKIAHTIRRGNGFGYDPIFYYPPLDKTTAELTQDEKSKISHRGLAMQKMIGLIINETSNN